MMNIINGGAHADNNVDMQEFMVLPVGFDSFAESLRAGTEIFHALKSVLKGRGLSTAVGDEGGFAPDLRSNEEALETILEAIGKAGYKAGEDVLLGLDVASSEFFDNGKYHLTGEGKRLTSEQFVDFLAGWAAQYPIVTIEDGMAEHDWAGLEAADRTPRQQGAAGRRRPVRDQSEDLPAGHRPGRRQRDPDQGQPDRHADRDAGSDRDGRPANYAAVVSHRSGETEDTTIADIAVATTATQIKTGSLCRSDRVAKYNQLLRIEQQLGAGREVRRPRRVRVAEALTLPMRALRVLVLLLAVLLAWLQYRLWFGSGGTREVAALQQQVQKQSRDNAGLKQRNDALAAEVEDLKSGEAAIEERARSELGMIKPGETFYRVVETADRRRRPMPTTRMTEEGAQ